ncbi:monothiol glutaredoxin-like protein-4 [Lineolata rhizophorae]|uniref:Monothiol glutaredoxin-like protein-4 n=1 Tax=Lineolata rhizophorae TaxID=578093 RepID=A0A6A6P7T9_9PEZI|nr:monothiol glutaredoxin-like protein-4 [Lineolata rhizophorae]
MSKVLEVTSEADFAEKSSGFPTSALQVLYFHAPWAAPCKQMSTILETLAATYPVASPPTIGFLSINAEEVPEVSEKYDVTAVPYLVLQKEGRAVDTVSGSDAAKVRAAVEAHAGKAGNPGKAGLPPAQAVNKVEQAAAAGADGTAGSDGSGARKLSAYAPTDLDPKTAPEYSSGTRKTKEELFSRLADLVKAAPVMLFMKGTPSAPQCGFSRQTVSLLRQRGIRYGFFNILADDDVRQGLKEYADWPTFPQLWVGGELVGGLDIVKEEFENDASFLKEYSVSPQPDTGGPAAPSVQAQPA